MDLQFCQQNLFVQWQRLSYRHRPNVCTTDIDSTHTKALLSGVFIILFGEISQSFLFVVFFFFFFLVDVLLFIYIRWYHKKNELLFFNSLKMKIAVTFGVVHMVF